MDPGTKSRREFRVVIQIVPRSSSRAARAIAIVLAALALMAMPALAGDVDDTRSTVEFGPDLAVSAGDLILSKAVLMAGTVVKEGI